MIQIIDRVLKLAEKALLLLALGRDVTDLPDVERMLVAIDDRQNTRLQAVPVRLGLARGNRAKRLAQTELFETRLALPQRVGEPEQGLIGIRIARQQSFECLRGSSRA